MHLILFRHGIAIDRDAFAGDDADRPLTDDGIARTTRIARRLREVIRPDALWTSPWRRAAETAAIIGRHWRVEPRERPWLAGGALTARESIRRLAADLVATDAAPPETLVLVGHEPDLGALAMALIGGGRLDLKKAGVVMLDGEAAPGAMTLTALLPPRVVLGID